jgi:hypothetical protein
LLAALAFAIISSLLLVQAAGIGASGQLYQLHPSERLVHLPTGIPTDLSTDREQFPLTLNAYDAKLQMGPYNDISSSSALHPLLELPPDSVTALATCDKLQVSSVRASSNDGNVPSNAIDNSHGARWSDNGVGAWYSILNRYSGQPYYRFRYF